MLEIELDKKTHTARFVLQQNQSFSWQANLRILSPLIVFVFIIAFVFAVQGLWLILPFAGLEISVLLLAIRSWFCNIAPKEVIYFSRFQVVLEKGFHQPENRWQCQRFWLNTEIDYCGWYLPKVYLKHNSSKIEIGAFLNKLEKKQLIKYLHMVSIEI